MAAIDVDNARPSSGDAQRRQANRRLGWLLAALSATFAVGFVVRIVVFGG